MHHTIQHHCCVSFLVGVTFKEKVNLNEFLHYRLPLAVHVVLLCFMKALKAGENTHLNGIIALVVAFAGAQNRYRTPAQHYQVVSDD